MFTENEGSRKTIGDVDVLYHEGLYHLFHLVLPNHDFIAHAVSTDCIHWRRVSNALFIGDPGTWDDLMLWTMHVSPDPHRKGRWRMFYTGLSRREEGRMQRLGLAVSDDLIHWRKEPVNWRDLRGPNDPDLVKQARQKSLENIRGDSRHAVKDESSCFPLEADGRYYEASEDEGRRWVSFRDPFFYNEDGKGWLIAAARTKQGPVIHRGCVSLMQEKSPNHFEAMPPLFISGLYDDVEVPNLIRVEGEYYLIGSIREDAKIRYWHTDKIGNPWRSYYDNVLMAQGNYAARLCHDGEGWLIWNFFTADPHARTVSNLMPPPKRLVRMPDGLLALKTFEGFEKRVRREIDTSSVHPLHASGRPHHCKAQNGRLDLQVEDGFQAFLFDEPVHCFRLQATLRMHGKGKCGILFRLDPETQDGYYLSLDMVKGIAQLRRWRTGPIGSGEHMMQFKPLQSGYRYRETPGKADVQLIAFGSYIEFSMDGYVLLSLADQTFHEGRLGIYLETAHLELTDIKLNHLASPHQSDEHLVSGHHEEGMPIAPQPVHLQA